MSSEKNFGYLGNTFQIQLINQLILNKDFARAIVDVLDSKYFDNQYFKIITQMIKEYYIKYESVPTFETLDQLTRSEISSDSARKIVLDTLIQIRDVSFEGHQFVIEKALKFCKQQELQKVMTKAQKIIDKGDFESYDQLEEMVNKALQVGEIEEGEQLFGNRHGPLAYLNPENDIKLRTNNFLSELNSDLYGTLCCMKSL